jgi:hypothetical protein
MRGGCDTHAVYNLQSQDLRTSGNILKVSDGFARATLWYGFQQRVVPLKPVKLKRCKI